MKEQLIADIEQAMLKTIDNAQLEHLHRVLEQTLQKYSVAAVSEQDWAEPDYIELFLSAKRIEGRSEKSLTYYKSTIDKMLEAVDKSVKHITTDDLRSYLANYQQEHKSSKVTIDNIRRILSTFFGWLEDEDYIIKSPVRRIRSRPAKRSRKHIQMRNWS